MIILGIETSTDVCAVGLADDQQPLAECALQESHIHSEKILTLVNDTLKQKKVTLGELSAIAVSIGPGSFTGLRIGLSTAKGLSYALHVPLIAVPTFEAMSAAASLTHNSENRFLICVDAKQGDSYVGGYTKQGTNLIEWLPISIKNKVEAEKLMATEQAFLITDHSGISAVHTHPTAYAKGSVVAFCGIKRAHEEKFSDIESIEPMYLKEFVVKTSTLH